MRPLAAAALCALTGAAISGCGSSTATAARAKPGHHGDPTRRAATGGHGRGRDSSGPAAVVPAYPRLLTAALGIADGHLVWAGGEHLTVQTLADALLGARVVRAVELDINPEWAAGYLYGIAAARERWPLFRSHLASPAYPASSWRRTAGTCSRSSPAERGRVAAGIAPAPEVDEAAGDTDARGRCWQACMRWRDGGRPSAPMPVCG